KAKPDKELSAAVLSYCREFYVSLKEEEKLHNYARFLALYAKMEARFGSKEKALELFGEYQATVNRMWNEDYLGDMQSALVKYKTDLKDQEIVLLNEKEQQARTRSIFIGIALALMAIVLVLIYVLYKRETRTKKKLDERNHKVEQLLREVHHRVKNNLQIVSSFINIQLDKVHDDVSEMALKDTSTRIMALAGLHHSLYRQDDLSRIQLKEYLGELCDTLNTSLNTNVRINYDLDELNLDIDQAIPIGLAVNELITNALKHAFTGNGNGQIDVLLKRKDKWELVVKDNGKGLPADLDPDQMESIGMRLVQDLAVRQLKGSLSYYNDGGAVFKIEFMPVAA
ncbi:MAG: sensor histidine kinase, partial [Bacteroidota bacterium]